MYVKIAELLSDEGIVWQVIILNIFRPNSNFHCP